MCVKLYKGSVAVVGRESATDNLYDAGIATFKGDAGTSDQADTTRLIKLNALRLRLRGEAGPLGAL